MKFNVSQRIKVQFLFVVACLLVSCDGKGGRGGGSRGSSSGSRPSYSRPSYSRPSYSRPAPAPAPSYSRPSYSIPSYSRPAPAPAPAPAPSYSLPSYSRPAPAPAPAPAPSYSRPAPAPAPRPAPAPAIPPSTQFQSVHLDGRQPAYNPNFKPATSDRQPAYNPNFKPDVNKPIGPPPPYSPAGQPVPNAPVGPPPAYQASHQSGFIGHQPSGMQPPPYPGQPAIRPPSYSGLPSFNPVQPVRHSPSLQSSNRPYPVQPGYPGSHLNQPSGNRPYPVQQSYQGNYHQPNINRPYPVQPGAQNTFSGVNRPYPVQPLGGNIWQPHHGVPAPAYMNYGGIPTGTNMYTKPHKKKGFIGSLMSFSKPKSEKKNKYYGSYPSPYGVGYTGGGGFLGKHSSSASMNTIFPIIASKGLRKVHKPKFGFMPMYMPRTHYHHYHHHRHYGHSRGMDPEYAEHYDVYDDDYIGKCQKPIKKEHGEVKCNSTFSEIECSARCDEGYRFPQNITLTTNKCWHVTGVWKPKKNFPECKPFCKEECKNGGECIGPDQCKCPAEFRGALCQHHFLSCDISLKAKGERVSWVCRHSKNGTVCSVRCKEPAQFESPPANEYRCSPDGVWEPETIPKCVLKEEPEGKES